MAADKKYQTALTPLLGMTEHLYVTRFLVGVRKSAPLAEFAKSSRKHFGGTIESFFDPHRALSTAQKQARKNDLILITGSFFLAGELRKRWISEKNTIMSARRSAT